jgi:beta-glucosidase
VLAPGASARLTVKIDPRLLATFDEAKSQWQIAGGTYPITLGTSARDEVAQTKVTLVARTLPATWRPARVAAGSF